MTRIAYVNGAYLPQDSAATSIEDRGYQFGDGVYEYCAFYNGVIVDLEPHLARLERSLAKLSIPMPMSAGALKLVMHELIDRNRRRDGGIYFQVTRGIARRDHPFPAHCRPILSMLIYAAKNPKPDELENGVRVITHPDERWAHCDIKAIALLGHVLAKQKATAEKAREAWLYKPDGTITEGAVSNAYIVKNGTIITHPADARILAGVARAVVLRLAHENGIPVEERGFTVQEAQSAEEAFIGSTSAYVLPVTQIDDTKIGTGKPGPVVKRLRELTDAYIEKQVGHSPSPAGGGLGWGRGLHRRSKLAPHPASPLRGG